MPATNKQYLTDRTLKALKPAESGKSYVVWDGGQDHFGVRVTDKLRFNELFGDKKPRPLMTFFVLARRAGKPPKLVWTKVGRYPDIGLGDAREAAREVLRALAQGKTPRELAAQKRREEEGRRKDTCGTVVEEFLRRHVRPKLRSAHAVEAVIRREMLGERYDGENWVPDPAKKESWRDQPISEITRRDVVEMIEVIVDRGAPYAAHQALANARKFFNWAMARDVYGLEANPCARIKAADVIGKPEARDRVLEDHEIRFIWQAAKEKGYPFGTLVQALLLTGQRVSEVSDASWSEIKSGLGEQAVLTVPAERMKGKAAHTVPLTSEMITLLEGVPRFPATGEFIFSTTFGNRPVSGFSKAKADLDRRVAALIEKARADGEDVLPIANWRLHDLRRTVRTRLSALSVLPLVAELVIGHKQTGIHAVYDLHRYDSEKRDALSRWERLLLDVVEHRSETEPASNAIRE